MSVGKGLAMNNTLDSRKGLFRGKPSMSMRHARALSAIGRGRIYRSYLGNASFYFLPFRVDKRFKSGRKTGPALFIQFMGHDCEQKETHS